MTTLGELWSATRSCSGCDLRQRCKGPVPAQLVEGSELMFVAEAPGANENEKALPLIGKAGHFFDHLLGTINLSRSGISVSNAVKCMIGTSGATPKPESVGLCAPLWLEQELSLIQPRVVVAMGAVAARYLLGARYAGISMEECHGLPFYPEETERPFLVFCTYHPAAGFHDSSRLSASYEDFRDLRLLLDGKLVRPRDEYPHPDYRELVLRGDGKFDAASVLAAGTLNDGHISLDFETNERGGLYCWSFSTQPGAGRVVFHEDAKESSHELLKAVCENPDVLKIFQNLLGIDYQILHDELGLDLASYHDTMVRSYLLSWAPQGLKPLCRRRLGMEMNDYSDLVEAARRGWLHGRLGAILEQDWPLLPPPPNARQKKAWDLKAKVSRLRERGSVSAGFDLEAAWARLEAKIPAGLVSTMLGGGPPAFDLSLLPRAEVIHYSARDADATLRLWLAQEPVLRKWGMIDPAKGGDGKNGIAGLHG